MGINPVRRFNVTLDGAHVETLTYLIMYEVGRRITAQEVRSLLISRSEYPPEIRVKEV